MWKTDVLILKLLSPSETLSKFRQNTFKADQFSSLNLSIFKVQVRILGFIGAPSLDSRAKVFDLVFKLYPKTKYTPKVLDFIINFIYLYDKNNMKKEAS